MKKANEYGTFVEADLNYRSNVEPNKARNLCLIGIQWWGATSVDTIDWGAVLYDTAADSFYTAPVWADIPFHDRTGGGDSLHVRGTGRAAQRQGSGE